MLTLTRADDLARELFAAIKAGNLDTLQGLLAVHAALPNARLRNDRGGERTPLHLVTDWPGYFPSGPAVAKMLLEAGADPNVTASGGRFAETPLHWAASSDDVDVAEVLIDGGADFEVRGGSIAGGSPLDNAVGYGCWRVARLLVQRGARVDALWHAAALGLIARMQELLASASPDDISHAFYQACAGGQRRAAELLLARGANLNYVPDYSKSTPLGAADSHDTGRQALLTWLREQGASAKQ
jgi:ankyrin repeat protein